MAKWEFTRAGTWDYPTLGFKATDGDILDATAAPDIFWDSVTDTGQAETVDRYRNGSTLPSFVEPDDGALYAWSDSNNRGEWIAGNSFVGRATSVKHAPALGLYFPEAEGAKADGDTDDTDAVNAAISAAQTAGGGQVLFRSDKTYLCSGAIAPDFSGTGTSTVQKPVRLTSMGQASSNGFWSTGALNGGATLDLRYDGTDTLHPAKIDTRGAGSIEIDHLNIVSGGSDDFPIFQTTNTAATIHHNYIQGNPSNTGSDCAQDAIFFGGTSTTIGADDDHAFQGYGGAVHDNYFSNIRRGFVGRTYCNSIPVERNTFSLTCGNDGTGTGNYGGAIEFIGASSSAFCTGNSTRANTIECTHYKYAVALYYAENCTIGPDGYFDASTGFVAGVYVDITAVYNVVVDGFHDQDFPLCYDPGQTTDVRTAAQSRLDFKPGVVMHVHNGDLFVARLDQSGPKALARSGDVATWRAAAGNTGSPSYPEFIAQTGIGTQVTDLATTSGSATVTSATAPFKREHEGMPINATGIPAGARILRYISTTSVELTSAATATATGVTAAFGATPAAFTYVDEVGFSRRHIKSKGAIGSPSVLTAAGTGATATVAGTDTAWTLTLTTGTSPTSGDQAVVAAGIAWSPAAKVVLTPKNAAAATAVLTNGVYLHNTTTNTWLSVVTALPASTALIFDVIAIS